MDSSGVREAGGKGGASGTRKVLQDAVESPPGPAATDATEGAAAAIPGPPPPATVTPGARLSQQSDKTALWKRKEVAPGIQVVVVRKPISLEKIQSVVALALADGRRGPVRASLSVETEEPEATAAAAAQLPLDPAEADARPDAGPTPAGFAPESARAAAYVVPPGKWEAWCNPASAPVLSGFGAPRPAGEASGGARARVDPTLREQSRNDLY